MKGKKIFALTLFALFATVFCSTPATGAEGYTVQIKDNIKLTGNLEATINKDASPASLPEGTYIEWFCKLKTESDWKVIIPTKYASGAINITENTLGCNVFLTGGARTSAGIVQYKAVITDKESGTKIAESDPYNQDKYWGEVQNSGFEDWPIVLDTAKYVVNEHKIVMADYTKASYDPITEIRPKLKGSKVYYNQVKNGLFPDIIWKSAVEAQGTQLGYDIEITRTETDVQKFAAWQAYRSNEVTYKGTPITIAGSSPSTAEIAQWLKKNPDEFPEFVAPEGKQFAEINSEQDGALYQDIITEPGAVLNWGLFHCARDSHNSKKGETDEMYVICMATKDAEELIEMYKDNMDQLRAELMLIAEGTSAYKGTVWTVSDKVEDGWVYRSSNDSQYEKYVVPENQYLTRFFFVAKQTACGAMSGGNLVDGMYCGNEPIKPSANQISLVVRKEFGGEVTAEDVAALKSSLRVDCTVGTNTIVIGSDSTPFNWSATDKGTYECRLDVPLGKMTDITIHEQIETALVYSYNLTTTYSSKGGSEAKRTGLGYVIKAQGGDVIIVTISNSYTKAKKELTIEKKGLKPGESSIFNVKKAGENTVLYRVFMTGTKDETVTATITDVPLGEYTVEETGWSWTYNPENTEITQDISIGDGNIFKFTNTQKETNSLHDEKYKVNKMPEI